MNAKLLALFAVRLACLFAFAIVGVSRANTEVPQNLDGAAKKILGELPGGVSIAYINNGDVRYGGAGNFGINDSRKISPDSVFEVGSVTKVFTSLLLAESERFGKVSRNDPVIKYLRPSGADLAVLEKITLVSLATHSSGLPRMPLNQTEANGAHPYERFSRERLLEAFSMSGPSAQVGANVAYSNFGVSLLGETLAAAWQQSYAEVLTHKVLAPLGLVHTTLAMTDGAAPAELVEGHAGAKPIEHWKFQAMAPAGALRSSARDMALFVQACLGLRETTLTESLRETFKPLRKMDSPPGQIGLAWMITETGDQPVVWHNGATGGFKVFVGFVPAKNTGVVVLASNSALNTDALGFQLLGVKPAAPAVTPIENARDYLGSYSFSSEVSVVITERRGALSAQMTAQPPLSLKFKSTDRFTVVDVPAEVSFERDGAGKIAALILHQNGVDQRAARTPELKLSSEKIAEYVGTFALTPAVTMSMTMENETLYAQLTGQPKYPLFASAPDNFFLKVVNAHLRFERAGDGKVVAAILIQNGREQRAPKQP